MAVRHLVVLVAFQRLAVAVGTAVTASVKPGGQLATEAKVIRSESPHGIHIDANGHQVKAPHGRTLNKDKELEIERKLVTELYAFGHASLDQVQTKSKGTAESGSRSESKSKSKFTDPISDAVAKDNILEEPDSNTKSPPDCDTHPNYLLCQMQPDHECGSADKNLTAEALKIGKAEDRKATKDDCAQAVFVDGGRFFVYGQKGSPYAGECWREYPDTDAARCYNEQTAAACCPELYVRKPYDFYMVKEVQQEGKNFAWRSHTSVLALAIAVLSGFLSSFGVMV